MEGGGGAVMPFELKFLEPLWTHPGGGAVFVADRSHQARVIGKPVSGVGLAIHFLEREEQMVELLRLGCRCLLKPSGVSSNDGVRRAFLSQTRLVL
jgi:hypothetical protein